MKELGGYFELELNEGAHYHKDAIALNSARNCFKYILKAHKPTKVYVPAYCCDSLIEPLIEESVDYEFYHVDSHFELKEIPSLQASERLVYINYFGLKSEYLKQLYSALDNQLIVDNTQSFFERPLKDVDTFYSPRKFFGVPDGGYLYTNSLLEEDFEQDCSLSRSEHLIGRYEQTAKSFYLDYQSSENSLINQPIKWMSPLTCGILKSLDYEKIALKRQRNFWALHSQLANVNNFKKIAFTDFVPMVYPFVTDNTKLRDELIKNKIYVAKYWNDAKDRVTKTELIFIENYIYIPIDQRITLESLSRVNGVLNA